MVLAVIGIANRVRRCPRACIRTGRGLGQQLVLGAISARDDIAEPIGDAGGVAVGVVEIGRDVAERVGHRPDIAICRVAELDLLLRHPRGRRRQCDRGQRAIGVIGKPGGQPERIGDVGITRAIADPGHPGHARRSGLGQRCDPVRPVIADVDPRPVRLDDRGDQGRGADIAVARHIGLAVGDAAVFGAEIDRHRRQAVRGIISVAGAGQRFRGRGRKVGVAGGDLGQVIARPAVADRAAVGGRDLGQLVGGVAEAQTVAVGIALARQPPAGAISGIGLDRPAVAVGPGPHPRTRGQRVVSAGAVGRDISGAGCIPAVGDDRAVARHPIDRAPDAIEGAGEVGDPFVIALAPVVAIVVAKIP